MMLAWAMRHPDNTRASVGIYPVCNLAGWPMKNKAVTLADYPVRTRVPRQVDRVQSAGQPEGPAGEQGADVRGAWRF